MNTADQLLAISAFGAAAFVVVRAAVTRRKHKYTPLWLIPGKGKFDVKNSWVTNTTLFGAILASALKDVKELKPPTDSGALNLLFAALALLAVLIYLAGVTQHKEGDKEAWYEGYVATYLLSSFIALWASFGQILVLGGIVQGAPKDILTPWGETVFLFSLYIGAFGLAAYAWKTMGVQLKTARKPGQGPPPLVESAPRRDDEWSLL